MSRIRVELRGPFPGRVRRNADSSRHAGTVGYAPNEQTVSGHSLFISSAPASPTHDGMKRDNLFPRSEADLSRRAVEGSAVLRTLPGNVLFRPSLGCGSRSRCRFLLAEVVDLLVEPLSHAGIDLV